MTEEPVGFGPQGRKELDTAEGPYHSHTQWLELHAFTAEGATGLISGQGTKFPQALQHGQTQKQQQKQTKENNKKDGHVKTDVGRCLVKTAGDVGVMHL